LQKNIGYTLATLLMALSTCALASNTSGVHGPGVKGDDRSMQLRLALSPSDEDGQIDNWAYRLHYQHSFNNRVRARVVVQYRDRDAFEYEYVRAEMLYNVKKKATDGMWSSGIRFDVRQRRSDNPEEFAMHWTNQWDFKNGIRVRGIVLGSWEFGGDNAGSGTGIQTRSSVSKKLDNGITVGVEIFNDLGRIGSLGSFDSQGHQIGPMINGTIGSLKYEVRYLAGVSNGSRDHNFGFRINKSF
jgi:hypothetical protein